MNVRLPGLLDASLNEVARLHPTAGSVTLKMIGSSEATMTLPEDSPAVQIHDWVQIYTQRGLAGVFRVSNVSQNYKHQIDVTLLHGIDILADSVWTEQTEFSGTKAQFLTALLNQQTHLVNGVKPWTLGTCEVTGSYEKTINYDRLSNLLEEMVQEGGGYYFTYDQTVFPWVINFVAKPAGVDSEFRLTRNVRGATVTYNDADLCTRLHLSVSSKHTAASTQVTTYGSAVRTYNNTTAQATWGIVVKTADIDTHDDIEDQHFESADAWAANFLAQRAEPSVQIEIDGDELTKLTGEAWDALSIGKLCQVALPDYGHTFRERVVAVTYPEFLKDPAHVTVSLANTLPKFSESIAQAQDTAASAAKVGRANVRSIEKDEKDLTTWSQVVRYQGEALDGTGVMTLYESGIDMDAAGGVTIYSLQEGLQALYGGIQVNSSDITAAVGRISTVEGKVTDIEGSALWINRTNIATVTGKMSVDSNGDLVVDNGVGLYVTRDNTKLGIWDEGNLTAGVVTGLVNDSTGQTYTAIDSDHIYLNATQNVKLGDRITIDSSGYTKFTGVSFFDGTTHDATINNGKVTAYELDVSSGGNLTFVGSSTGEYYDLSATNVQTIVTGFGTVSSDQSTGVVTIPYKTIRYPTAGSNSQNINFNIANMAFYQNHVGISSTGSWLWDSSDEVFYRTITANDGTYADISLPTITASAGNFAAHVATVTVYGTDSSSNTHAIATTTVDATGEYTSGQGSVSATLTSATVPSGTTPTTLSAGNYGLFRTINGTAESTPIGYYNVASGGGVTDLDITEVGQTPYDASTATEVDVYHSKYYIVSASSSGNTLQKKFHVPAGSDVAVTKGTWTITGSGSNRGYECEFSPASGSGASKYVRVLTSAYIPGAVQATIDDVGSISVHDFYGGSYVGGQAVYLQQSNNYAYITSNSSSPSVTTNVLARLMLHGSGIAEPRDVSTISSITLQSDQTTTSTHTVTVSYDDGSGDTSTASVVVDASAITSVTQRIAENLQDTIVLSASDKGTVSKNNLTVEYDNGSSTNTFSVVINAAAVYEQGKTDGAGQVITGTITNLALYTDPNTGHTLDYNTTNHLYTAHVEVTGSNITNAPYHEFKVAKRDADRNMERSMKR